MKNELRQLTATVTNPNFDRRCKVGLGSVAQFSIEQRFVVRENRDGTNSIETVGSRPISIYRENNELIAKMIANSERVEAEFIEDVVAEEYGSMISISSDVINRLIANGKVSVADVRAAVVEILEEDA
jgi:hypothetical protein